MYISELDDKKSGLGNKLDLPDDLGGLFQSPSLQQTEGNVELALGGQSKVPHLTGQCQLSMRNLTSLLGLQRTRRHLQSQLCALLHCLQGFCIGSAYK